MQFKGGYLIEINTRVSTFIYQDDLIEPYLSIKLSLNEITGLVYGLSDFTGGESAVLNVENISKKDVQVLVNGNRITLNSTTDFPIKRVDVFNKLGVFDIELGRKKNILLGREDTEIQYKIHLEGKKVIYNPKAIVHHVIGESRAKKAYFYRRTNGGARTDCIIEYREKKTNPNATFYKNLHSLLNRIVKIIKNPKILFSFKEMMSFHLTLGYFLQSFLIMINKKKYL